ncbi:MAG: hypothetical protein HY287_05300 [Planctomycetes bacterium]|nr:hypothetical protein [Planctomycetota bacterium]MBI3833727.1 hypothetical protein [Planctomycetota bacterium]
MPVEARCPECGRDIINSLGSDTRPGSPWEHRKEIGRAQAWWRTFRAAVQQPEEFGLRLCACKPRIDHRSFIALHLPLVFLIAAASVPTVFWIKALQFNTPNQATRVGIEFFTIGAPIFGSLCALAALAVTLAAAGKVAFEFVLRDKRNLLSVSMQASAYLMPYLVFWEFFGAVTGIWCIWLMDTPWMKSLFDTRNINRFLVCFMIWFIPNVTIGIYHFVLVRRITRAARWANK